MRLPLKYIVLAVIVTLVCVFAYQAYWLMGLYRTEAARMDADIREAMTLSDYNEIDRRIERMRNNKNGAHGVVDMSVSIKKDDDSITQRTKEERQDAYSGSHEQTTQSTVTYEKGDDEAESVVLMMTTRLVPRLQTMLHEKINSISEPDILVFDSVLTAELKRLGITSPHMVRLWADNRLKASTGTHGYKPDGSERVYTMDLYSKKGRAGMMYELVVSRQTQAVLWQMAGILCTSLVIMLVLALVFWYLIHVLMRLKTLDRMKSDFTNSITHELKTPIAVAFAANDAMLNYGVLDDTKRTRAYIAIVQEQLQRLGSMVEQILSMVMEQRNTLALDLTDIQPKAVIEPLAEQQKMAAGKPVTIVLDIEPENLTLKADSAHFRNIVSNLIDNAIKYSGDSVCIRITARRENGRVCIAVADNGIGIPQSKLKYVFDRFYRVTDGNRYTVKGYGLGLFYVKSMMEKMNGSVSADSRPGRGTTFKLCFNG